MWHIIAIQRARGHVWMVDVDLALGTRQTLEEHLAPIDVVRIAVIPRPDCHPAVAATEIDSLSHTPLHDTPAMFHQPVFDCFHAMTLFITYQMLNGTHRSMKYVQAVHSSR
jgi:hypothetical protein